MVAPIFGENVLKRTRKRRTALDVDERQEIVQRVLDMVAKETANRAEDREMRLQRYAKFRQWTEGKDLPWENSSDIALPDITEACLSLQDTLTNAILSSRPVVSANAVHKANQENQRNIDRVLDYQFFVEMPGEQIVDESSEKFVLDGHVTWFTPWIREDRKVTDLRIFDPIPDDASPGSYLEGIIRDHFPDRLYDITDEEGWDYRIRRSDGSERDDTASVRFYTRPDRKVEMVVRRSVVVYDGPRVIVKDYDEVLFPVRSANLQAPSPSNPGGAPFVILIDNPTAHEIHGLIDGGFYDLPDDDALEALGLRSRDTSDEEAKEQRDVMEGVRDERAEDTLHRTYTRLVCFDTYDLDGDGVAEDVIWWVLKEDRVLLKATSLTEMYPPDPPRRPLAHASLLPVKGRVTGISLPELMEGLHDFLKSTLDLGVDGATLASTPFFFYRAASSLKPEIIRPWPGDGIPIGDPSRDLFFPQIPFDGSSTLNMFFTGRQLEERLTSIGDLQSGRVPQGKSSALRTTANLQTILAQGEARPERVLRRFFMGFAEVFRQMHGLNQYFWPDNKQIRVLGPREPGEDPYPTISRNSDLEGRYEFDFRASVLNASKVAKQQGLVQLLQMLVNPLMLQLGMVGPNEIHRMLRDFTRSTGNDPDRYLSEPSPGASETRVDPADAIALIGGGIAPHGLPAPDARTHLEALQRVVQAEEFGAFDIAQMELFKAWFRQVAELAVQEEQQARLMAAAEQFQRSIGGGEGGRPPGQGDMTDSGVGPAGPGDLMDETLPGARGGVVS